MAARRARAELHAVLLAGGGGTRFWPLSRRDRPKQFLALAGRDPLLVETFRRARRLAPASRIWVVAPPALQRPIRKLLPRLDPENVIREPAPRDTAPAVGLACATIERRHPGAVVGIFPTDHVVSDAAAHARAVRLAARRAERGSLVCLGVRPDRPATGFGYLECVSAPRAGAAVGVSRFVEKPDRTRVARYLRSKRYLWNAGIFVWRAGRFLEELGHRSPRTLEAIGAVVAGNRKAWGRTLRQSVDYAVMERASGVEAVVLDAGWSDLGSWSAAATLPRRRGGEQQNRALISSEDSVVFGKDRFVAVVDVPNVVVVDTDDALLVVSRSSSERVREVVDVLRRRKRTDLL